jgi:hypothetical protein
LNVVLAICFVTALLLATTPFLVTEAEARSADEPCSYLHKSWQINPNTGICGPTIINSSVSAPTQNYAVSSSTNTPQQINCGEGTVLNGNLCVIDFRYEIVQGQIGGTSAVLLPVTNLFDQVPAFPEFSDPVLIGFFILIFIGSIFIGRQFSRKKRITRRNRKQWRNGNHRSPNSLVVTSAELRKIQEFEMQFKTLGKSDPEYFLHVTSGAELIDASRRGNELYSIDTIIRGKTLKILKYRDRSTQQLYISFVPDEMKKADKAMAWKFQIGDDEYGGLRDEA